MANLLVSSLASQIGKTEEETTLPNGATRMGLNWLPSDLGAIEKALKAQSALGGSVLVEGVGPQWLMLTIAHALHPCAISLADPKVPGGFVAIDDRRKPGEVAGDLTFVVTDSDSAVKVEYSSETPIAPERLANLVPPATTPGKPVALTGRTATWAVVQIGMAYAHYAPAVFVFQPGLGFVCAITHNETFKVGDVYKDIEDIPAIDGDGETVTQEPMVTIPQSVLKQLVDLIRMYQIEARNEEAAISEAERLLNL